MNRNELDKLIEEKRKASGGTLTDADVYEIGQAHKSMPLSERDWSWLGDRIGWLGTPESLRTTIKRRAASKGELKPAPKVSLSDDDVMKDLHQQKEDLLKIKQNVRDEWSTYKRYIRDDARLDSLKEFMVQAARSLEPLDYGKLAVSLAKNPKRTGRAFAPKEAIAMVSDWHIGVECDSFSNKYSYKIAVDRVMWYVDELSRYCNDEGVSTLNVVNLGDLISGIIHPTIRLDQEFDVITQTMRAAELLANFLGLLNRGTDAKIVYRSCTDNHARVVADKNEALEKENFFRLIDWFVEERLKGSGIVFAHDNISDDIGAFELGNGKFVVFAHGDKDDAGQAFQHFVGATGRAVDYALLAHAHTEKMKNYQNMRVFGNGSVVGGDSYSDSKRLYSKPSQTLLVFDGSNVISHIISLDLKEAR